MAHRRFVHCADKNKSFDEELIHDDENDFLLACSPHGGMIEKNTDWQSVLLEDLLNDCSAWLCRGFKKGGGAYDAFHRQSTEIGSGSFYFLPTLYEQGFEYALAFHGFNEENHEFGGENILIGGNANQKLKCGLREYITDLTQQSAKVITEGELSGNQDVNFVNEVGANGIQLEQCLDTREQSWRNVVRAVQLFFEDIR